MAADASAPPPPAQQRCRLIHRFDRLARVALVAALAVLPALPAAAQTICGDVEILTVRQTQTLTYSYAEPDTPPPHAVLLLLPGGDGVVDLDVMGCAQNLAGNSLIRSQEQFREHGFATALLDAPTDWHDTAADGLGGFRTDPVHAADIGIAIANLRERTGLPVYLVGTSRGTISAANAAARLTGASAPDALVLTSPITAGVKGGQKPWVSQTVFDIDLAAIRMPVLVIAHAADTCPRTPPQRAASILDRTQGVREQSVLIEGGPAAGTTYPGLKACAGRTPHGYVGQEADVANGIARFLDGGRF